LGTTNFSSGKGKKSGDVSSGKSSGGKAKGKPATDNAKGRSSTDKVRIFKVYNVLNESANGLIDLVSCISVKY